MTSLPTPFLSIVIPVHNEENRLPARLERLVEFLQAQKYSSEVLLVENGSSDHTLELAESYARRFPWVRVFQERQRGKGLAVKRGMLEALGEFRFMCDVDFSMPVAEINRFLPPALVDCDIAIASREAPGAVRYGEPAYRHLIGRFYNLFIRLLALPGLHDTQCGFKCFRRAVAEDIFRCQTLSGWSFDVEVLFVARRRGYRILELPVPWYFDPESKVHVFRDSAHMAMDIFIIRLNQLRDLYSADHEVRA